MTNLFFRSLRLAALLSANLVTLGHAAEAPSALTLWYRQPAVKWTEALPIGNGR